MKYISLFSGIGAFEKALTNLGVDYELTAFCEVDKYAVKSYCAIHGVDESKNLGDITKVDENTLPKDIDLVTYGFPCQDISLAGKQKGLFNEDGTKTRSGLFFEALRIIEAVKPCVAIAENVKNLTSKKFAEQFKIVLDSLEKAGYNNYWKVLNAKDYGVPQNRERVFIISIRKDIDTGFFQFHEGFPLQIRLKDLLEESVDEKYFVSDKGMAFITNPMRLQKKYTAVDGDIALCLTAKGQSNWTGTFISSKEETDHIEMVGMLDMKGNDQVRRVYSAEAVEGDSINFEQPNSKTRRGRVGKQVAQTLTTSPQQGVVLCLPDEPNVLRYERTEYGKQIRKAYESGEVHEKLSNMREFMPRTDGIANTLTTVQKDNYLHDGSLRIRKLTPKECFRLMGFDDADSEKAEAVNSNSQLHKQAGNSIVVPVVQYIIEGLFDCGVFQTE